MNEQEFREQLHHAAETRLSGLQGDPWLAQRVMAQAKGEARVKKKLSVALILLLIFLVLTVTAIAVSILSGFRFAGQEETGSPVGCTAMDNVLYYMTVEGLCAWEMESQEQTTLVSGESLAAEGISIQTLLFHDQHLMLLDQQEKKLWTYREDALQLLLDYRGTEMDLSDARFADPVFQDGYLFLRVIKKGETDESAVVCKVDVTNGALESLPVPAALELAAYQPGKLLVLQRDLEAQEDRLLVIDTDAGNVLEQIYVTPVLGMEGIAYAQDNLCAMVNGELCRWNGSDWTALASYAPQHLSYYYAILDGGYVSVSHEGIQYVPLDEQTEVTTLTIRGYRASDDVDHNYQLAYPGVAVQRHQEADMSIQDVREAIESGDTTDLFHVKLDADVLALIDEGWVAPLSSSAALVSDAEEMLPQIVAGIFVHDELYAVPSELLVTVWSARKDTSVPKTMEELLEQHLKWNESGDDAFYVAQGYAPQEWQKEDYARYLLKTYLAQMGRTGEAFDGEMFGRMLKLLTEAAFQHEPGMPGNSVLFSDMFLSLQGKREEDLEADRVTVLPPAIGSDASPTVQGRLHVYLLNPNSQHKEAAIAYLEYVAAYRSAHTQALLKPESAQPVLHAGVEAWIEDIITQQRAMDAEEGIETDEAALAERVEAIKAMPESWEVTETALEMYREEIVPCIDLMLRPIMASSASQAGKEYDVLLQNVMSCLNGQITIEECVQNMDELLESLMSV